MRILRTDIEGLDLVLGGGVPLIKRHESFAGESATIVVRGAPGSGKTVFGTEVASSLARSLRVDVAYACVELLPSELAAQRAGIKRPAVTERVVEPPFPRAAHDGAECRIYAGVLDLGDPRGEQARLLPAIDEMFAAIRESGGKPGVLVVDSLSDGYHLGHSVPRPLADELCKMAVQQGLILILLEETSGSEQSAWCFAADLVIDLDIGALPKEEGEALQRRARFTKNRFGPCEPGPHRIEMIPELGLRVYPNPAAHTRPWAVNVLLPGWAPKAWSWGAIGNLHEPGNRAALTGPAPFYSPNKCGVLVFGPSPKEVTRFAGDIGATNEPSVDVLLSFGSEPENSNGEPVHTNGLWVVPLGTWFASDQIVATAMNSLSRIWATTKSLGRVFIGDLHWITAWSTDRKRQTLGTILRLLQRAGIPQILVETGQGGASPFFAFAEIGVRAIEGVAQVTLIRLGEHDVVDGVPTRSTLGAKLLKFL